jgi:hypothetical protein
LRPNSHFACGRTHPSCREICCRSGRKRGSDFI